MLENLLTTSNEIPNLRTAIVITMPDCLLYDSWSRGESSWSVDDAAGYFGDLVRANRRGLQSVGAWSTDMQITIESADALLLLRELDEHFVCCAVFERATPLGMARLQLKMLLERVRASLPDLGVEERSRGVRVMEFLERYAPDPHAVLLRVATRTGITLEQLRDPAGLSDPQVQAVEDAAKRILGLEQLHI